MEIQTRSGGAISAGTLLAVNDDRGEVGKQVLTMGTASEMLASLEGKRTKPF